MDDLDRDYVIYGHDLLIALRGMNGRWPAVPNPRTMAGDILGAVAEPLEGHRGLISQKQLAERLEGFRLTVMPGHGPVVNGEVDDPSGVAKAILAGHSANLAHSDGEVADAHICCEHAGDAPGPFADPEVAAMAALAPVLPLVSRLGHDARERVMNWAKYRACDGLPPF